MKRFVLRMQNELHQRLREEAHVSRKSINSIIVETLEDRFDESETIALEDLGLEGE